jgi:hypothetical protein
MTLCTEYTIMMPRFTLRTDAPIPGRALPTHYITWDNRPVPAAIYDRIVRRVNVTHDYAPMSRSRSRDWAVFIANLNKEHSAAVTLEQVMAIRNVALKDKIIKNYHRMNMVIAKVAAAYEAGNGILALSLAYDFPPANLLRGIFLHLGYDASSMHAVFANKGNPADKLSGRDLEQYRLAEKNDAESTFNQQLVARIAADNERALVDFFRGLGVGVTTQDDLVAAQVAKHGRAILTPDLLFREPVFINGIRCYWIDYKDYIGTTTNFLYTSNKKQAAKYAAEWGPGAMCFHRAYVNGVVMPGAMLLDATATGIAFRENK